MTLFVISEYSSIRFDYKHLKVSPPGFRRIRTDSGITLLTKRPIVGDGCFLAPLNNHMGCLVVRLGVMWWGYTA